MKRHGRPPAPAGGPYEYDWVGNRLNPPSGSNHMVYNAADELTLWPGMHSYGYDNNGALTAVKTADGSTTQQSLTHHPTELMDEATFQGGTLTNIFDPTASIPAILEEQTPGNYYHYVDEPNGPLIAVHEPEVMHWYHFDELGSTRRITVPGSSGGGGAW